MRQSTNVPIIILAVVAVGLVVFGIYKYSFQPPANPGAKDIPAKTQGNTTPIEQREGGPRAPGMINR